MRWRYTGTSRHGSTFVAEVGESPSISETVAAIHSVLAGCHFLHTVERSPDGVVWSLVVDHRAPHAPPVMAEQHG